MAQAPLSSIETALENQPLGGLQIRVAAICTLIQMCDGYDVGSIGWAVPSLTHAWHVPPSAFALAFLWSNLGVMAGALSSGPIGDRFGRKPLLLISIAIFGLASFASAFAPSLGVMAGLRFFTGLGIAGGFAGTTALTADYAPRRLRATMIMVTFTGAPLGGFLGGQVVALLLRQGFAWPIIFVIGGVFPLVLLLAMALWLPESPRFLAARTNLAPRHQALLARLDIAPGQVEPHAIDLAHGNPVGMLFAEGYAPQTILLWIIFFCSLLTLYLYVFWMPEILHLTGMTPSAAVFATSLHALGGIVAVLYLGYLIDRFRPERALALHYVAGRRVHRDDRAGGDALSSAAGGRLLFRRYRYRQSDRRQCDMRGALSGAHADQRHRLGPRHRASGRHRRSTLRGLPVGARFAAAVGLFRRRRPRDHRCAGDGAARVWRQASRRASEPASPAVPEPGLTRSAGSTTAATVLVVTTPRMSVIIRLCDALERAGEPIGS